MKHVYLFFLVILINQAFAQKTAVTPTVSPSFFRSTDQITVTYDVTGTTLKDLTAAYLWVWIPGKNLDAKYNINPATAAADPAKMTKSTAGGKVTFSKTFKPSDFFQGDISNETEFGMLLKGADWANGQTTDFITPLWNGQFTIQLKSPLSSPLFVSEGESISIAAETPVNAEFKVYVNDVLVDQQSNISQYSYSYVVAQASGSGTVKITATAGSSNDEKSFEYIIAASSPVAARPAGIIPGINYGTDPTKATLCLWAPEKSSVFVRGDFTGWEIEADYLMSRDGEYFWLEIDGLVPGTEYAFQYLVDETVYIADPYADKILDPDDQYIPAVVYPGLKPFPEQARSDKWYFNRVSVLQTNQVPFDWQVEDFARPEKEKLVIYELLIRDFFASGSRSYKALTDTISYFKRLGVNAVQLMPIMEFNGNESWGYNPAFMFAPDKYYGPKDELKKFIDECHKQEIAVILDIAMNHQDMPNSYLLMDFDYNSSRPNPTNKWFNVEARHPFNVFFDMNHESTYTKAYLDTINHYWLNEYKVDGFRFDLSKGFTQRNNPTDVGAWSAYDDTRVAILKRMADEIWEHTPGAYVILEHLAVNTEEKELAEYRADEGKGMMLWGNLNYGYNQLTMGYASGADIGWSNHTNRTWTVPHVIAYMESHDEERLMYRNINFGKTAEYYSAKNIPTGLERVKAASVLFYSIPGPKMLWQFGEFGYDFSINTCPNGSISDNCRVSPKPVKWEYLEDNDRALLFEHTADLIDLHTTYDVFAFGTATVTPGNNLLKQITLKNNPYTATPANTDEMNVQTVVNLDLTDQTIKVNFPHTGIWYDYYNGGEAINVTATPFDIQLDAAEFRLFTDVSLGAGPVTSIGKNETLRVVAYPNPTTGRVTVPGLERSQVTLVDANGSARNVHREGDSFDISHLPAGVYILVSRAPSGKRTFVKVVKY